MLDAPYNAKTAKQEVARRYNPVTKLNADVIKKAVAMMKKAKKPIIYGGGGIINADPHAIAIAHKACCANWMANNFITDGVGSS